MASNHTEHYQLSQWEPGDKVERLDFNGDNEKIDAAIKAAADLAAEGKALGQAAYGPENSPFVVGRYVGNGEASQEIALGFEPKAVFISSQNCYFMYKNTSTTQYNAALAIRGHNAAQSTNGETAWVENVTLAAVTENGFQVACFSNASFYCNLNGANRVLYYIALR